MAPKSPSKSKPKLTDAERHARFKEMAREVQAGEDPKDFEKAFQTVAKPGLKGAVTISMGKAPKARETR